MQQDMGQNFSSDPFRKNTELSQFPEKNKERRKEEKEIAKRGTIEGKVFTK